MDGSQNNNSATKAQHRQIMLTLAVEANRHHDAAVKAATTALQHAMDCGRVLADAKAECDHGEWSQWLDEHFDGGESTARRYMQLYRRRDELTAKRSRASVLSIREATRILGDQADDAQAEGDTSRGECRSLPFTQADLQKQVDMLSGILDDPDATEEQQSLAIFRIVEIERQLQAGEAA